MGGRLFHHKAASQRILDLEHELRVTKENLCQTVTELESVNAELQAANEELLTANEELQSSNEELQSVEIFEARGEYHFQAIIMDLMMPTKNGVEAAKEIRSLPLSDAEDIPIIALTADVTDEAKERARNAGMNTLISKPIDRNKLFAYLARVFEES